MRERSGRVHRATFWAWVAAILGTAAAQSTVHLYVVLDRSHVGSAFDLDRSNSLPDLVDRRTRDGSGGRRPSARRPRRQNSASAHCAPDAADDRRRCTRMTAPGIAHRLARDWRSRHDRGAARGRRRPRGVPRAGDTRSRRLRAPRLVLRQFADELDAARFERERGDPIAEYQIVAKEGFELIGWSLVALALWDEALRREARFRIRPEAVILRR